VAEIKYKEGRHVGLDIYDLLIEEMTQIGTVKRLYRFVRLNASGW
jgi:hypothetical protein